MPLAADDLRNVRHQRGGEHRARRIPRRVDEKRLGSRRHQARDLGRIGQEAARGRLCKTDRRGAGEMHDRLVVRPARIRNEDLVSRIDDRHQRRIERADCAGGDHDLVGTCVALPCSADPLRHALAQRRQTRIGAVLGPSRRGPPRRPPSMICDGVEKSGSPTSRWMTFCRRRGKRHDFPDGRTRHS